MKSSLLTRRVAEVIDLNHLRQRLESGEKLRVKLGIDPSKPELHIGHAITLQKLREFQDAGHHAILIIGDTTAQIGDPTDRSVARKMLSVDEVNKNAETYLDQAFKILDESATEVHRHSEWFGKFDLRDVIELMATTTVNNLLSHETFGRRITENQPLHAHEILYPLLQGYDSVMVASDIEIGGMDQKFNVLMGRTVQRAHKMPEQDVVLLKYLPGLDGQAKMSKTLGNTINLTDSPADTFGKVMSIDDSLIPIYLEMATNLSELEVKDLVRRLDDDSTNPRDIKEILATAVVTEFHSKSDADQAAAEFDAVFRHKKLPEDIETLKLPAGEYDLVELLVERTTLVTSKGEARRLLSQNGVRVNQVVADLSTTVSPKDGDTVVVQVGPRRFARILWK